MTNRLRAHSLVVITAVVLSTFFVGIRIPTSQAQGLNDPMPIDPQITIGKFANGMRYYIRANKKPEKRAQLRLVVNAGSMLADDDQQGLAHLVGHIAFNGTTHCTKNNLVALIQSLGMRVGAGV